MSSRNATKIKKSFNRVAKRIANIRFDQNQAGNKAIYTYLFSFLLIWNHRSDQAAFPADFP